MNIINWPSAYGRSTNKPIKIVWHAISEIIVDDEGWHYYAVNYLESLGYSAHAFITPSGLVIRTRKDSEGAYHARDHNKNSLGVEVMVPGCNPYGKFLERMKTPYMTHDQKVALYELFQHWMRKFNLTRNDVYRHSDLSPDRKHDPGSGVNWEQLNTAYRMENEK